jgi:hypothetical protein
VGRAGPDWAGRLGKTDDDPESAPGSCSGTKPAHYELQGGRGLCLTLLCCWLMPVDVLGLMIVWC